MIISEQDLDSLGQFVINELGVELIKQNHKATGKLIASLDYNTTIGSTTASLLVYMNDYGRFVNTGRRSGAKRVPIQALVQWIKDKGIASGDKKILGIAFAIQKTIQKEGSPTVNSRKRGKKVEFVDDTLARIESEIDRRILEATSDKVSLLLDNFVRR